MKHEAADRRGGDRADTRLTGEGEEASWWTLHRLGDRGGQQATLPFLCQERKGRMGNG